MKTQRESLLQQSCVTWFKYQYPDVLIAAIPNGGDKPIKVNKKGQTYCPAGAKSKAMGEKAGMPDLMIFKRKLSEQGAVISGLAIELKVEPNKQTVSQRLVMTTLSIEGWETHVITETKTNDAFAEIKSIVENYLGKRK